MGCFIIASFFYLASLTIGERRFSVILDLLRIHSLVFANSFCCFSGLSLNLFNRLFLAGINLRLCRNFNQPCDGLFTKKALCKRSNLALSLGQALTHLSICTEEGLHLFGC